MKNLQDVKDKFRSTNGYNQPINILAFHPGQDLPILAEYLDLNDTWIATSFYADGSYDKTTDSKLSLVLGKKHLIDYSKLPKDILCSVGVYDNKRYSAGDGLFYQNGCDSVSNSTQMPPAPYSAIKVIENKPQVLDGSARSCPIPKGIKFTVTLRNGKVIKKIDTIHTWEHHTKDHKFFLYDVISYQILGEL